MYYNPPTRVGVTWKYLMQDPNDVGWGLIQTKIQNPNSKIQTAPFGAATKRTKTKLIQNPKSKLQNPNSKIQNPRSKIQNPKSKLQTPKSKLQTPKSKRPVWSLDFGFGRAGTGGDGYVANDEVWPCWPPEFGLDGGTLACSRKVAGSAPPTRGPNWAPISGGGVLPEIEPRFPAPCRGNRGPISGETAGQAALLKTLGQHRAAPTMCVGARDVNITWHRPCVHMQETSTSHSIMDFCCVGNIYTPQASFSNKTYFWTKPSQISKIIILHLNKSYLAVFADLKLNASWL